MCQMKHKLTADIAKGVLHSAEYILLKNKGNAINHGNSRSIGNLPGNIKIGKFASGALRSSDSEFTNLGVLW